MKKYFLAASLLATVCNIALGSSPEETSNADLYILSGFSVIVILLTVAVWWLTIHVRSTLTRVFAYEKSLSAVNHGVPSPIKNLNFQSPLKTKNRFKRWAVVTTLTSLVLIAGVIAIYGRSENVTAAQSAPEAPVSVLTTEKFNPSTDQVVIEKGKIVFQNNCTPCHGSTGGGNQVGPNLTDDTWLHGGQPDSVYHTINNGVVSKGMPAWGKTMPAEDVTAVASFVLTLAK